MRCFRALIRYVCICQVDSQGQAYADYGADGPFKYMNLTKKWVVKFMHDDKSRTPNNLKAAKTTKREEF